jgi:hypothetical protein
MKRKLLVYVLAVLLCGGIAWAGPSVKMEYEFDTEVVSQAQARTTTVTPISARPRRSSDTSSVASPEPSSQQSASFCRHSCSSRQVHRSSRGCVDRQQRQRFWTESTSPPWH